MLPYLQGAWWLPASTASCAKLPQQARDGRLRIADTLADHAWHRARESVQSTYLQASVAGLHTAYPCSTSLCLGLDPQHLLRLHSRGEAQVPSSEE